eukprot:TRINITY_DN54296_c0_g1_i1.p1 TRINITY_DN54296_c0_g1~~TRINITY_DN54296_c0_g1_i1.p1  ORF type:complete len:333 (+),score=57.91 TRINITY_DN54296_c0_g1_i1:49-1047(+)
MQQIDFPLTDQLREEFRNAVSSKSTRAVRVDISDEALVFVSATPATANIAEDCQAVAGQTVDNEATYFALQLPDDEGWTLLAFVPDSAKVKQRMLYASTTETLRKGLGVGTVTSTIHCSVKADLAWDSIKETLDGRKKATRSDVMTQRERERQQEAHAVVAEGVQTSYVHGVAVGFNQEAQAAITGLVSGTVHAVILRMEDETIGVDLTIASHVQVEDLVQKVTTAEPRFVLFRFHHEHDGTSLSPVVFAYICPGGCKVKHRMVYSTTKASVVHTSSALGLTIDKKLEFSDATDLTTAGLVSEFHPPTEVESGSPKFTKPTRPGKGKPKLLD